MAAWQEAVSDLQAIDSTAIAHGSRVTGLAHESSDVDMMTSLELSELLTIVNLPHGPGSRFDLIENVSRARVPRVRLNHKTTGIEVDVINKEAEPHAMDRDAIICSLLSVDKRVVELAQRIGNWVRQHKNSMPPNIGYPNSYTFRLTGFHYLMVRPEGPLLPPLATHGSDFDTSAEIPYIGQIVTGEALFYEWLRHLVNAETQGLWVDLRNPSQKGNGWRVVDPCSGRNLTEFRDLEHINTIAGLARRNVASYEREKKSKAIKMEFEQAQKERKRFNGTELIGEVKAFKRPKLNSLIKVKGKDEGTTKITHASSEKNAIIDKSEAAQSNKEASSIVGSAAAKSGIGLSGYSSDSSDGS